MTPEISALWVYLSATPLLYLTVTILVFIFSAWINRLAHGSALLHPVVLSFLILIGFLLVTDTSYDTYFEGAQFIHFLLGPAIVALAVPLYTYLDHVKKIMLPILVACTVGSVTAALSAVGIALLFDAQVQTVLSLAPKSVTSPIAMGIAEEIGGLPALTAGLVLITGTIGCLIAAPVFRILKIEDPMVKGFALGLSSHGFGTVYALEISQLAGALAGLGIGLTGVISAFVLPVLMKMLGY
jgi:predicted murein hydrolase (TIGR00659 family)